MAQSSDQGWPMQVLEGRRESFILTQREPQTSHLKQRLRNKTKRHTATSPRHRVRFWYHNESPLRPQAVRSLRLGPASSLPKPFALLNILSQAGEVYWPGDGTEISKRRQEVKKKTSISLNRLLEESDASRDGLQHETHKRLSICYCSFLTKPGNVCADFSPF